MNRKLLYFTIMTTSFLCLPGRADEPRPGEAIPEPRFDRINYERPQDYLELPRSLGTPERIRALAASLKADSPARTLLAIGRWMNSNLACDNRAAYAWRDFDRVLDTKVYGGCADQALVFGALARACGIPTGWVKTMDADWIREFRSEGTCTSWRGHVFLEVYLDGRWQLLDASGMRLYGDYDPAMRILPGGRYAYDKGGDPKAMLLSTDWERWKRQTAGYFADFDLSQLPVGEGRPLGAVYVVANSPIWQAIDRRARALGHPSYSFNTDFKRCLAMARGGDLIITWVGDQPIIPEPYDAPYRALMDEMRAKRKTAPRGVIHKQLDDGTRVILVYGEKTEDVLEAVESLEFGSMP